jgi:SOS-response transcriptional repressor LexA
MLTKTKDKGSAMHHPPHHSAWKSTYMGRNPGTRIQIQVNSRAVSGLSGEKRPSAPGSAQWGGLWLTGEGERRTNYLPLVGRISAGRPIEAISN